MVGIEHLQLVVAAYAGEGAIEQVLHLPRLEGAVVDGVQIAGRLHIVGIGTRAAQLVVALDGGGERVGVEPDHLGHLGDGICLVVLVFLDLEHLGGHRAVVAERRGHLEVVGGDDLPYDAVVARLVGDDVG